MASLEMQDHRALKVWQRAHQLTIRVVLGAKKMRRDDAWLASQMKRSSASIGANIAEGAGQESPAQFGRFLVIALASVNELSNHCDLARDIGAIAPADSEHIDAEAEALRAMLTVLLRRVREREAHRTDRE